ncbi:MAG: hypothetical protein ACI9W4_000713 [Rhodothermales bacterium]|jgi:hypothetical protein
MSHFPKSLSMLLTALILTAGAVSAQITFPSPLSSAMAGCTVSTGFIDGDANLDVAQGMCYNAGSYEIRVSLGNGNGTFAASTVVGVSGSGGPGDLGLTNGDSNLDIVVAASAGITTYPGNGDGTFGVPIVSGTVFSNSGNRFDLDLADMNGDGFLDAIVAAIPSGGGLANTQVFLGNGTGSFSFQSAFTSVRDHLGVIPADFNGDGIIDVGVHENGYATILLNDGAGNVSLGGTVVAGGAWGHRAEGIDAGDLNGDGNLDLLVSNQIVLGNGDGTLQAASPSAVIVTNAQFIPTVALLDLSGDGVLDVILGGDDNTSGGSPSSLIGSGVGQGDGTFGSVAQHGPGIETRGIAWGDFDNAGGLDLLVIGGSTAYVFLMNGFRPDLSGQTLSVDDPISFAGNELSKIATITNDHFLDDATISGFSIDSGSANPQDFSIGTETCTAAPISAGGGMCTVEILFAPGDAGPRSATVLIASDIPASPTPFVVSGFGSVDFGDAPGDQDMDADGDYDNVTRLPNGARHLAVGATLGAERDTEADASNADAASLGDDTDVSPDDEDGVSFALTTTLTSPVAGTFGVLVPNSTASATITASAAGYLNVFVDGAGSATDGSFVGDQVGTANMPISAGVNTVTFAVPGPAVLGNTIARFRLTDAAAISSDGIGLEPTGEVEDYFIVVDAAADIEVGLSGAGGSLSLEGGNLVVRDSNGTIVSSIPTGSVHSLTINGDDSDETISFDWGLVEAVTDITFNLGNGFDALVIEQGAGTPGTITYQHINATSGSITDGVNTVNFAGLDPIIDVIGVGTRIFTFLADDETIVLSADGDGFIDNGMSFIDGGAAEEVSFANPTSTLEVNTANGTNSVLLGLLDTDVDAGFLGVTVNGGTGSDTFTVTPASYPIMINGAANTTCPGDGLVLDLTGGAVVDVFTYDSGTGDGSYTFSSGHEPVTFTGIEQLGESDLSISANLATLYATQDLTTAAENELVVTVTNDGATDATCVTVELSQALAVFLDSGLGVASTGGAFAGTEWSIPLLEPGEEATLTITGLVVNVNEGALTFTVDAFQDTDETNNVASVTMSFGFQMPAKTHVNAALYYEKTTTGGAYDALIVGLYQGSPGIDGAVWCKVPEAVGSWPTIPAASIGNLFRPCSNGLPFPLHVNDIFEDASGTLWLATWGNAGLYKSEDDGESWTDVEPILGSNSGWANVYTIIEDELDGVLYISANNGLVFLSLNDGDTWQQLGGLPGASADTPWSMTSHPTISGTIYAGTFGNGVFVSEDFGFTWEELDDAATVPNENDDLLDTDMSGDDFAGHIFDLEFSPDLSVAGDHVLYAGTGNGVWQAELAVGTASTFVTGWTQNGPTVTLDDLSTVTPEVRTLAFVEDAGDTDDNLVAGTWGFGAFEWVSPNALSTPSALTLKEGEITFVAVSPTGGIFVGASSGATAIVTAASGTSTASEPGQSELPEGYALGQNYPNPFNPVTTIGFSLPETGRVKLSVFDGLGREVAILVDGTIQAGNHEARFDAKSLPTGAYLYRLSTDAGAIARTLILMK